MKALYDYWEAMAYPYEGKINGLFTSDTFTLDNTIPLCEKKIKLGSKFKLNSQDKETKEVSVDVNFTHNISPNSNYAISHKNQKTIFNGNFNLFQKGIHRLSILPKFTLENTEIKSEMPISAIIRYHLSNHTLISLGMEDYEYYYKPFPKIGMFNVMHGHEFENGLKVFGGFKVAYNILEKMLKTAQFALSFKKGGFNSLLGLDMSVEGKSSIENKDSSSPIEKKMKYDASLKADYKVNDKITIGGDTAFNMKSGFKCKCFTNYQVDKDTIIKGKWEDKDKSISLLISHCFRGLARVGVIGKLITADGGKNNLLIPQFKSKIGVNVSIDESLI